MLIHGFIGTVECIYGLLVPVRDIPAVSDSRIDSFPGFKALVIMLLCNCVIEFIYLDIGALKLFALEDDDEFVSAYAVYRRPKYRLRDIAYVLYRKIACLVAVGIVDILKPVQVYDGKAEIRSAEFDITIDLFDLYIIRTLAAYAC